MKISKTRLLQIIKEEIQQQGAEDDIQANDLMYSAEDSAREHSGGSVIAQEILSTGAPFIRVSTDEGKRMWDFEIKNKNGQMVFLAFPVETKRGEAIMIDSVQQMLQLEKNLGLDRGLGNDLIWNPKKKAP